MRTLALVITFLSLLSSCFAANGYSKMLFQKTWTLTGSGTVMLDGVFLINNSNQRVLELNLSDGAFAKIRGEEIRITYNGPVNNKKTIYAVALVEVTPDTHLIADTPFNISELPTTNLTTYTSDMRLTALSLVDSNSTLNTIKNITNWVHHTVVYNPLFVGKNIPAKEVFNEREGVCTEYTHLLISLYKSIGLQTRFVSGYYLHSDGTVEPHAWSYVYIPGDDWIAVDATFGAVGFPDITFLATSLGEDQTSVYDYLQSSDSINMGYNVTIVALESYPYSGLASLSLDFDKNNSEVITTVKNNRNEYIFLTYRLNGPVESNIKREEIILLAPLEEKRFTEKIDLSKMEEGFVYYLPFYASIQGAEVEKSFTVAKTANKKKPSEEGPLPQQPNPIDEKTVECAAAFIFLLIAAFLFKEYAIERQRKG